MKIVDLKEYKNNRAHKKQIEELEKIGEDQYHFLSPIEKTGYRNFLRLLKLLDEKAPGKPDDGG